MNGVIVVVAASAVAAGVALLAVLSLARRVVRTQPRRKTIVAKHVSESVVLPRSPLTIAPGVYGLWFGEEFDQHACLGEVMTSDENTVTRRLISATADLPTIPFHSQWTGHSLNGPQALSSHWEDVSIPLRDGTGAPAWFFPAAFSGSPWVIHVQGIRTSRIVALRSVEVAQSSGLPSLVVTFRGAGDGPPTRASNLGQREWTDLADAIVYAREAGASEVFVVGWSMGAGIALEVLRREPDLIDKLALIAPATNWRKIIRHGVVHAGLPGFMGPLVTLVLGSRTASRLIGLRQPINFDQLEWSRPGNIQINVPTLVIHSKGDKEIPFELTTEFADAHPNVTVVETASAPHGWESNVDPERFQGSLSSWLSPIKN